MTDRLAVPALRLTQWLDAWNDYDFDADEQRRKPDPYLYLFSMPAGQLRQFTDVYKRQRTVAYAQGIQREREESRTARIQRYIQYGYPFGDLSASIQVEKNLHLRKPGWLPTAIVINVLTAGDLRHGRKLDPDHIAYIHGEEGRFSLDLPCSETFTDNHLRPLEVIDGQHRLWAFTDGVSHTYSLPVVAFVGLDIAWQAYLFWSINISPKRINPSHAFDLYPILRSQDWLEATDEIAVYREARSQEIVEWLYRYEPSTWYGRINMLGQGSGARVSQATWVRSLISSFFGTGRGRGRFGMFQTRLSDGRKVLPWSRPQQIGFIVEFWVLLRASVATVTAAWRESYLAVNKDPFLDRSSMLNQDMGVRAVNAVLNDIFYLNSLSWKLDEWFVVLEDEIDTDAEDIDGAISSLREQRFYRRMHELAGVIAEFDWRSLDGPDVRSSSKELEKRAYRGSGGYTILVRNVLEHVTEDGNSRLSRAAESVLIEYVE